MSPTFQHVAPRDETSNLQDRVDRLRSSMEWAKEAIPVDVRGKVNATIQRCDERLALGVDHTVVALAGGTGSGKSTLFNALAGEDFAIPGVARPTTSQTSSVTFGAPADALLDWLEVAPNRRLGVDVFVAPVVDEADDSAPRSPAAYPQTDSHHGGTGNAAQNGPLGGLILLDLPDHDSVESANRAVVDRIVPMSDLLLWVVDPQKYADNALHEAYLRVASDHGQPSLVVLNQVDRLTTADAWEVAKDLQKLLEEDGLTHVPVIPVSAKTGQGMDVLRAELAGAAAQRTVAAEAVRADLVSAGRDLARALSRDAEPRVPDIEEFVGALARAAGVDARAEASAAVAAGRAKSVPPLRPVPLASVERERLDWVDEATTGLPVSWRIVVGEAVVGALKLTDELNATMSSLEWPEVTHVGGIRGWMSRATSGSSASKAVLKMGRDAVRQVVTPLVIEPTEMIHQAYRVLDELTELE
ncbi:GTPase family protein [Demequina aurantiaca]|uniref:GTPase family protein n=1 Tax=Demequina aurantiaca TaxID=676200 RepID=UPI000784D62F|nr:dynamin family protein [Demequina aurantiaca]